MSFSREDLKSVLPEDLSNDETKRLTEAMADKKFVNLFSDYLQSISDPSQREENEKYLQQVEIENGLPTGCKLLKPEAVMCVKLRSAIGKLFINICQSNLIDDATSDKAEKGMNWHLPYSIGLVRSFSTTKSNTKILARAVEVVFATSTIKKAQFNERFQTMLIETAVEAAKNAVDSEFEEGYRVLKHVKCKSGPPAIMRVSNKTLDKKTDTMMTRETDVRQEPQEHNDEHCSSAKPMSPQYEIIHHDHVDVQSFANNRLNEVVSRRPDAITVKVHLPLCKSMANAELDVSNTRLKLKFNEVYNLDIALPYPVLDEDGSATFSSTTKTLAVKLPVQQEPLTSIETNTRLIEEVTIQSETEGAVNTESLITQQEDENSKNAVTESLIVQPSSSETNKLSALSIPTHTDYSNTLIHSSQTNTKLVEEVNTLADTESAGAVESIIAKQKDEDRKNVVSDSLDFPASSSQEEGSTAPTIPTTQSDYRNTHTHCTLAIDSIIAKSVDENSNNVVTNPLVFPSSSSHENISSAPPIPTQSDHRNTLTHCSHESIEVCEEINDNSTSVRNILSNNVKISLPKRSKGRCGIKLRNRKMFELD